MLEVFLSLGIFALIVLGLYIAVFLAVWQGGLLVEKLKRKAGEEWE